MPGGAHETHAPVEVGHNLARAGHDLAVARDNQDDVGLGHNLAAARRRPAEVGPHPAQAGHHEVGPGHGPAEPALRAR